MVLKKRRTMNYQRPVVAVEHTGFYPYLLKYFEAIRLRGYTESTAHRRESQLRGFIGWCDERGLSQPNEVTKPILERYQRHLFYYRQENTNKPLTVRTQNNYMASVRAFFKYLTQQNYLLYNPASELVMMKQPTTLPVVLSEAEVESLLQQPDTNDPLGVRDRAILELFYSTGLRRSELCRLELQDVSFSRKTLFIRQGKGGKDRLVPIGDRALRWLTHYVEQVRDQLLLSTDNLTLFLSDYGDAYRGGKVGSMVKRCMKKAGIDVSGSCHLLRHAMATHMLEHGADIRFIQAMLGHTNMSTTEVYTHVSIRKLQEVHAATHPAKVDNKNEIE